MSVSWYMVRLVRGLVTIIGAVLLIFIVLRVAPGDPARILLGERASEDAVENLRQELGLNDPLVVQVTSFLGGAIQGDLGESLSSRRPAMDLIVEAFPRTLQLAGAAFLVAIVIALPAGMISARRRGSWMDHLTLLGLLVSQSLPTFWIGILLIQVFAVNLGWFPTSGAGGFRHLVLPAITMSSFMLALTARTVRSALLDIWRQDFIRTAQAKGLSPSRVLIRHGFPNILLPVVTILALQLGTLLGGAFVTEAVFAWPGIGRLALGAALSRDYPLVQATVIFSSAIIVSLNLLADLLYPVIDPRLRHTSRGK